MINQVQLCDSYYAVRTSAHHNHARLIHSSQRIKFLITSIYYIFRDDAYVRLLNLVSYGLEDFHSQTGLHVVARAFHLQNLSHLFPVYQALHSLLMSTTWTQHCRRHETL